MMRFFAAAALLAMDLVSAPPAAAQTLDRTDPQATARAALSAYQARDLARLASVANGDNRPRLRELAAQGERHPRYASMFQGWRWEAVEAWGGTVDDVRYVSPREALVSFGRVGADEVAVVVLTWDWEAGGWAFEDINSPDRARFEAFTRTRPPPP